MENSILNSFPMDPGIFLIVLLILNMILIIITIRCTFYYKRLYRGYDVFMRGKDAETDGERCAAKAAPQRFHRRFLSSGCAGRSDRRSGLSAG